MRVSCLSEKLEQVVYGCQLIKGLNTTGSAPVLFQMLARSSACSRPAGAPWGLVVVVVDVRQAGGSILISRRQQRASAVRQ